ncbi:MAG: hypothetical protein IJ274_10530 [Lachnospiraceae bacterium]|nr:hypothetical protein [Lachnospiraceae bacterium]
MFRLKFKKAILLCLTAVLCLSGCGEVEGERREVSPQFRGFGIEYLFKERGLKESGVVYEDAPVDFQDKEMEKMLRNMIGKPEGEVYISDLQAIHRIYWLNQNEFGSPAEYSSNLQEVGETFLIEKDENGAYIQAKSLEDLAYCYNLQEICFGSMEVPSLKPLANLPQLEKLDFTSTIMTEEIMNEIGMISSLKILEMGHKEFTDFSDVTDGSFVLPIAEQLVAFYAAGGIDWSPEILAQMTNLESLYIEDATDLSFCKNLPQLKKLYMTGGDVKDWSPIAYLENLEYLYIGGNSRHVVEVDFEALTKLKKLGYLGLTFTTVNREYTFNEIVDAIPSLTGLYMLMM